MNTDISRLEGTPDGEAHASDPQRDPTPAALAVSVIIAVLNEEKVIGQCLDALKRMHYSTDAFEIIIVDNGSTDRTLDVVTSYSTTLNITILSKRDGHISAVRNCGAASARGEILAFLDADCLAPPTWLEESTALLSNSGCGVIGGFYLVPENSSWVARAWYGDEAISKRGITSYVPSGNLLVSRSNFFRAGGFDESLETNEDFEFCQRANKLGLGVMACPEIGVIHLGTPQTYLSFYRKQRWHGKHVFKVFLRDVAAFPNGKPILFSIYSLLCLVGLTWGAFRAGTAGRYDVLTGSACAFLLGSLLAAVSNVAIVGKWRNLLPMTALYMAFGFARAICLLDVRNLIPSRKGGQLAFSHRRDAIARPAE